MNYLTNSHNTLSQDDRADVKEKVPVVKIAFLDVGQGDTIVISCSDTHEAIVVDCVDARSVQNYLKQEQIEHLRGIIITHLHADHYKGVADLLNNCSEALGLQECEVLACNDIRSPRPRKMPKLQHDADGHSTFYEQPFMGRTSLANLFLWCRQNKLKCEPIRVTKRCLPFTGTLAKSLQLVHPYHADYDTLKSQGLNNTAVVLRISGPHSSALLTGDLEPSGWQQLQINHPELRSDVLKFPHHGGAWDDATTDMLLDAIKPSIVVISVGTVGGEKYQHPNADIFTALSKRPDIRVLCTQATHLCHEQKSVLTERNSVVDRFQAEASRSNQRPILSRDERSCPCAGTIIVELGDKARVLLPEITFHRESIIKSHFKRHKCEW